MKEEEKINSVLDLNEGDCILINSFKGDTFGCVSSIIKSLRYSITDSNGRKHRSLGRDANNKINYVYADEEDNIGDEEIREVGIVSEGGCINFDEDDDLTEWNIRRIDKTHPKYNKNIWKSANNMSKAMNMLKNMFDEN
jgi:hypothetical protein